MNAPEKELRDPGITVCVVIPAYNAAAFIGECLCSVFAQSYTNYEVIVINDYSPDTPQLEHELAPYTGKLVYLKQSTNVGLAAVRNRAILETGADYIALLDSDDVWTPNCLESHVRHIRANPHLDVVYGDAIFFGGELSGKKFMDVCSSNGDVTFEALVNRTCNVMISVLAKRSAIVGAGLFDVNLRSCEDFDLWGRMLKMGYHFGYHRQVVMNYRRHPDSLSADEVAMSTALGLVYQKFRDTLVLSPLERAAVDAQIRRVEAETLFWQAKQAFIKRDFDASQQKLTAANTILHRPKLSLVARLLQVCPSLLHWVYSVRAELKKPSKHYHG